MRRPEAYVKTAAAIAALFLLAGCASTPSSAPTVARPVATRPAAIRSAQPGEAIAGLAAMLVGTPYRYGGSSPREGFDCSGLVFYTYAQNGFAVPRTSEQQFKATRKISLAQASAGDLLFFQDQQKLSHVGIYLGDGRFVHAPTSGRTVSVASLDTPYYRRHLVGVGRLLPR